MKKKNNQAVWRGFSSSLNSSYRFATYFKRITNASFLTLCRSASSDSFGPSEIPKDKQAIKTISIFQFRKFTLLPLNRLLKIHDNTIQTLGFSLTSFKFFSTLSKRIPHLSRILSFSVSFKFTSFKTLRIVSWPARQFPNISALLGPGFSSTPRLSNNVQTWVQSHTMDSSVSRQREANVSRFIGALAINYVWKCSGALWVRFTSGAKFNPLPWQNYKCNGY